MLDSSGEYALPGERELVTLDRLAFDRGCLHRLFAIDRRDGIFDDTS